MAKKKRRQWANKRTVPYRRKRDQKTDYKQRLHLLLSQKPRLVIRKSLKHIQIQLVEFALTGDKILASAHSRELAGQGYEGSTSNMSAAYLTGLLLAKKAKEKKVTEAIVDFGIYPKNLKSKLFAVLKGASDGGLNIPINKGKALPSDERVLGTHIENYAKKLKEESQEKYSKQFSKYQKVKPEALVAHVTQVKDKLIK